MALFLTEKGNAQVNYLNLPLYNSTGYGTLTSQSNITISGRKFTNNNAGIQSGVNLQINSCSNITIENCFFDISYNTAVVLMSSNNITIRNCLFANNNRGVYAVVCTGNIKTLNNQFINMQGYTVSGEYHRGQLIQYNQCTGPGNEMKDNRSEQFFGECYNQDLINTYASVATSSSPLTISGNIFRGGSPSGSGGGIIGGDGGGNYVLIENNKLIDPGQYGIACAGGQNVTIRNNQVYAEQKMWNGIGYYVANFSPGNCGNTYFDNTNRSNYKNSAGVNNEYWSGGTCNPCNCNWPTTGQSLASMNIPNPLITFISEDELWQLRSNKAHQSLLIAEGQKSGGGNGAAPVPIDLSRPEANAGADQLISGTISTLTSASTSSAGNVLIGYRWVQVSGPNTSTIVSSISASTNVTGLVSGTYVFRLEVTQNNGDGYNYRTYDADWVTVTVNAGPSPNQAPTANAGNDINLTFPTIIATLNGSATDPDGTIASYSWSRASGPTVFSITNLTSAITTVTGLIEGTYVFRLTVTDDDGATDTDDVTVTVNPLLNQLPTANAGNDITLTLPANSTTLTGSGSDPDGTIASNVWSRVSGPATFTLEDANSATTTLSNLVAGTYVFRLTVTDNSGTTATDDVTVIVNAAPQPPVANAGSDITLTLPVNSTTLTGSGSDPDGPIISYAWSRVSGPTTFTFGSANTATTTLSNLVQGTYVFRLTVTDNSGATATDDVTVIVNATPNQVPVANAGSNITLSLPTNSTTLTGSGSDPDGTITSYAWSRVSGPTTFTLGSANAASTTLSNLVQGSYVFRLTVTDNSGATAADDVTVTVNAAPNQVPTANAGNNIVLALPTNSTTLTGSGSDPDGTIASYAWSRVSGPTTFTFGSANTASTTLSNLVQGTYTFRLTVTDNSGATATDDVTVTVNAAPNQAPTANAGSNIVLILPTNSTTLPGSGSDPDGTLASYAWSRVSGPTTFTLGSANAASTTLSNLVQGTYVFRLTVTDNGGATATDDVTVTVNAAPNQAPTANAGSNKVLTLPTNSTTLTGSGSDPDGTISSYAWSRVSGPTTFTFGSANAASTTLSNLVQGTYTFRLTVTDNSGATATADVTVTVNAASNQAPTANAGSNIVLTLPTNSTTLTGSATDADGTITNYAWSRVSGPTTFTFGSANTASTTLSNLVQGTYTFRLTVTDNNGATDSDDMTVIVNTAPVSNQAPIANAGSNIILTLPTSSTTLTGSGTDGDGTIASYAWSRVSGPTTFTFGSANAASTTLSNLVQGTYVFRLTVTDNGGATATDDVTVTVNAAPNQAPTANAGSNKVLTLPTNSTTLTGSGSDPDGTISSYAWSRVSGPTTFTFGSANAASTTLSNLVQGTYTFRLTVTDNSGATATDDVTVTVNAASNQAPTANAGSNKVLTLPTNSTTLTGSATDADGTITNYAWSRVSGPTTFTFGSANAASTTLSNLVQGTYTFRLTVTDNSGATDSDNMTVIVNAAPVSNQAPIANAGNNVVISLPANSITLNGNSSTDSDGTIASYSWSRVSGPTTFTLGSANTASTTLSNLVQGTYTFRLTVTDNSGATDSDNMMVTVNAAPNQVPAANAGNNIVITLPVNSTTLNGSGTDLDGTISSYRWSRVSGPTTFSFANANAAVTALSNLVQGTYVFRLTVTDNGGATATDDVTVTVNAAPIPNQAPTARAGSDIVLTLPTNFATLNGNTSSDPDGTIVSYSWSRVSGPTTFTFTSAGSAATGLNNLVQGTYVFRLTVTDDDGTADTDNITVTVNTAPNQAPTANAGNDKVITLPTNSTTLTGSGADADGTIASYAWSRISGPTTFTLGSANAATTTLSNLVQGTYVFRLTVTDNRGATATDNVTVTVNAAAPVPNQPPVADAGSDQTIALPSNSTTLYGNASYDSDGTITSYRWQQISGPGTSTLSSTTAAIITLSDLQEGSYTFRLIVKDNRNAADTATVNVTVLNNFRIYGPVALYPNPANDIINVVLNSDSSGTIRFNIYDMQGRKVMPSVDVDKPNGFFTAKINVSQLRPGTYTLEAIMNKHKKMVSKFVKQ